MKTTMNKHVILLSAAAVLLFSCSHESEPVIQPGDTITFTAAWAGSEDTRTILQADGTSVWWEPGAQVNVFFSDKASGKFTSTNSQAQAIVDFQGSLPIVVGSVETENPAHAYWAVYPYNAANTCDGESVTLSIPSTQTAKEETFADKMFPSIATSTNFYLAFYNVCGGVRFTVANEGIASVTFKANNGESLAGKVKVGFDGVPVVKSVIEGASEVVVNAPTGGFIPGEYYFATLLPQTLSKGVSLTFKKYNGTVASTSLDNSITINRSRFGKMESKDEGLEFKDDGSGPNPSDFIVFADPAAKYACVAKFDTDGDGEVSYEEAEAATSFSGLFNDWKGVSSFDEIRYFKNVHSLSEVFQGCNKLVSIDVPESIDDLGSYAFDGCSSLESINLPSGISAIGNYTFQNCSSLVSIDIPSNVTWIGQYAFYGCYKLASIEFPAQLNTIERYAFSSCSTLSRVAIPDAVIILGKGVFSGCSKLLSATIPSSITSIPASCFQSCSSLTSVSIPASVISVGDNAFSGVKMWNLELPSSITSLGSKCFGGSSSGIICIILPSASPVTIKSDTFDGVQAIFVPSSLIDMYGLMTNWTNSSSRLHPIDVYRGKNEFSFATSGAIEMGTSVKWAAYNLGATSPEEYGDYYAWGETQRKGYFAWGGYKWCNGSYKTLTKYCPADRTDYWDGEGTPDGKTVLDLEDDAAHANWGDSWRMPTDEELSELREGCAWEWTAYEGTRGYKVFCFESGKSIFFPAAGIMGDSWLSDSGSSGYYWSSSLTSDSPDCAQRLDFKSSGVRREYSYYSRCSGISIRPVCD